mgnify:CR=1 FL=1
MSGSPHRPLPFLAMLLTIACSLAAWGEEGLLERLPARDTLLCFRVDVGRALRKARENVLFIDEEAGGRLVSEVQNLYGLVRELGARYDFRPQLLEDIAEVRAFLVVMRRDEPVPATDARPPLYFRRSLVVETDEATATDFLQQFEQSFRRFARSAWPDRRLKLRRLSVTRGDLLAIDGSSATLGTVGGYLVLSKGKPVELWRALTENTAEVPPAGLLQEDGELPGLGGLLNLRCFFRTLRKGLEWRVERAAEEAEERQGDAWNPWRAAHDRAKRSLESFRAVERLLNLDRLEWLGLAAGGVVTQDASTRRMRLVLTYESPISGLLTELLNGSGEFAVPGFLPEESGAVTARMDLKSILAQTEGTALQLPLPEETLRSLLGVTTDRILEVLTPDFYVTFDLDLQSFGVVLGVRDLAAAGELLGTMAAADGSLVTRHTWQQHDLYCLNAEAENPVTAALRDRYLILGTRQHVTDMLDRAEGEGRLAALARDNPRANIIMLLPGPFREELQRAMQGYAEGPLSPFGRLLAGIRSLDLGLEDAEVEDEIKESLQNLARAAQAVQQAQYEMTRPATVVIGRHGGDQYEMRATSEVRK